MTSSHSQHYTAHSGWFPCKAKKQCPKDPFKRKTIISGIIENMNDEEKAAILNTLKEKSEQLSSSLIDRVGPYSEYYKQTEEKHFAKNNLPGSKFSHYTKLEEPLTDTILQHGGSLENLTSDYPDDREQLVALGSDPQAFLEPDKFRYFLVQQGGTVGIKNTSDLHEDDTVSVIRTKTIAPCNIVLDVPEQQTTNYGVLILQQDEHKDLSFITSYPGPVTKAASKGKDGTHPLDEYENQVITVKQMRSILKRDIWANTRVTS
jgi:hypothetical protein